MRIPWDRDLTRLMLALALTCALGWLFKAQCGGGWSGFVQYTSGCYSDAVPFWGGRGVAAGEVPYFQARMEYPVLTGALIWVEGGITRLFGGGDALLFLSVVSWVNAGLAALVLWMLWRAGMEPRRLWTWACAPPLVLYVGHNWDMLAVTFAVAALLLARAGKPAGSAAAAGLGMAAKLFPVLLLPLIGLQAVFGSGGWRDWAKRWRLGLAAVGAAIGAWAAVNLPVALLAHENWSEFYRFSGERSGTAASVWEILQVTLGVPTSTPLRNLLSGFLFLGGGAAIVAFGWARHRERLWVLFTPLTAWFLLTNKVYSPQFDLWLYPLLVMTAPRLRPVALFVIGDVCAYFAEFWWLAGLNYAWPSATPLEIALAAGVRGAAMLWLICDCTMLPAPEWISRTATTPAAARTGR